MSNNLHFFTIPALAPAAAQETLNRFLAQHRVVTMEKQWLAVGADSHWVICVTVAAGQVFAWCAAHVGQGGCQRGPTRPAAVFKGQSCLVLA